MEASASDDDVVYELDITNNGKKIEVVMSPNGKIFEIDNDEDQPNESQHKKKETNNKDRDTKKRTRKIRTVTETIVD